jgi:hypothetical protein
LTLLPKASGRFNQEIFESTLLFGQLERVAHRDLVGVKSPDDKLINFQSPDSGAANGQSSDGDSANRQCTERECTNCDGTDRRAYYGQAA